MATFRVLVTGSRDWGDDRSIFHAFNQVITMNRDPQWPVVLIHGGAKGLDSAAAAIAHGEYGWDTEEHLAQWDTHTVRCPDWHWSLPTCKMAGHRRNAEMVASRADVCFAFIKNQSPGATGCAALAETANIPTFYYRED